MLKSDAKTVWAVAAVLVCAAGFTERTEGQRVVMQPRADLAFSAHRTVEAWITAGAVGALPDTRTAVPGLVGVRVTLRDRAMLVGMGDAYVVDWEAMEDAGGAGDAGRLVELEPLLQQATAAAITHARRQMQDATFRRQLLRRGDVGEMTDFKQIAGRMLVDVQVGFRPERIVLNAEDPPSTLLERYAAGYHGLRLLGPGGLDGQASFEWPATALSVGMTPLRQFRRLLHGQGLEDRDLVDVALPGGPALSRFDVLHAVRPRRDRRVSALVRGNPSGSGGLLGVAEMQLLCDALAKQLAGRTLFDGRVYGPYQPHTARYVPEFASDQAAGLVGLALARLAAELQRRDDVRRAAKTPEDPPVKPDPRIAGYSAKARLISERLAEAVFGDGAEPGEDGEVAGGTAGGAVAALALFAVAEIPGVLSDPELVALADRLAGHLVGLQRPDGSFVTRPGREKEASQASSALFVAALSSWLARTAGQQERMGLAGSVRRGLDRARERLAVRADVQAAPWLMMAENTAEQALGIEAVGDRGLRLDQLAALLDPLVNEHQITVPPVLGPADVLGGFLFAQPAFDAAPDPGWRSAVCGLFIAAALRNEGVIAADDRQASLLALGLTGRFLDNLTLKGPGLFMAIDHRATAGGVRRNLWDTTVTPEATAMALLALTETTRAVSEIDQAATE
ncbi:MAG: hypothetical protein AAGI68_11620 [Planctomycetota bacterium]